MLTKIIKIFAFTLAIIVSTTAFSQESGGGVIGINPSPSPDGKQVVFSADFSSPDSQLRLWIANIDGSGLRQLMTNTYAKIDEEPSWSPAGNTIAFSSFDGTNSNIWTVAADGSRLVQLTSGSLNNHFPVWSPDGQKIAFISDRGGSSDIWIMNADGTGQSRLTTLVGEENHPSFSPDGSAIVFSETHQNNASLMVINVDGTGLRSLTNNLFRDWNPSWGVNGIVFSSNRDTASEHWKVWIVNSYGTGLRKFGDIIALDPVWTKDGNILFSDELSGIGATSAISMFNPTTGIKSIVVNQAGYAVGISIRNFHEPHMININSRGKLRVAILSSQTFNAVDQVDTTTVTFGHSGLENSLFKCYKKGRDSNGDGIPDLICRFYISRAGFLATDTRAILRFTDINGTLYQGSVSVKITSDGDDADDFVNGN